jgi:cyanophycinase
MKIVFALLLCFAASAPAQGHAQTARGTLMIVGGGPSHPDVTKRFVELARGGKIIVFPMASSSATAGTSSVKAWTDLGGIAENVNLTHDQAMSADTASMFKGVSAIWFPGGDQSRITAAIGNTPVATAIRNRYMSGAVVGGTSAGAAVMSAVMITGDEKRIGGKRPPSDSTLNFMTIDRDNVVTVQGLGLVTNVIVDQHFLRRKRHNRLISLVLENPKLVGAGIDESTAIEVRPDGKWRVWGESAVVIYDARDADVTKAGATLGARGLRMHVLPAGSEYDLRNGKAKLPE